ncbi:MAG: hypothetical protein KGJ89_00780 [Patescibacteria group bacterium]|nr:hypothetical protein [Patescibacteria group bacterium]MDE2015048.1 hypothetical protein [Patescibacteria group bacterium]MDE2226476.1 hypothetical protein [Patescibacteria group bacterium]
MALSVRDKILVAMYDLSQGSTKPLKYEDIVVAVWKKFPEDFSLRGYEYPDSSDIHKPLYGPLKSKGFIRTANKFFSLTEHGLAYIGPLVSKISGDQVEKTRTERLGRDEQAEADKLFQSDAFKLYEGGEKEKILDSDIYAFYSVTVRTGKNEFLGRIAVISSAIENARRIFSGNPRFKILNDLNKYLLTDEKFKTIIPQK